MRNELRCCLTALTSALLIVGSARTASAEVPATLTHQGRLFDAEGHPVSGATTMQFAFYDAPNAAVPVASETLQVTLDDGYFSVTLGDSAPLEGLFDGQLKFFGITVGEDPEMSPRVPVQSVPYAITCNDATGDLHPTSISVGGSLVIDEDGQWVGDPTGLLGPTGPQGEQGPPGPPGPEGPPGPTGPVGATGPMGSMGPVGATGPQGTVGATGAAGPTGPQGMTGAMGAVGPTGPQGVIGAMGAVGPTGPQGMTGAMGAVGPTGPQGATGLPGPAGAAGPQGIVGAMGAVGPMGPQGPAGATGAPGAAGPQGIAGAPGAVGPTGPQGSSGAMGPTGPAGPQGGAGAGYFASSNSSVTLGTGTKTFTTSSGLAYQPNTRVRIAAGANSYMEGLVTAYSGTTLTVNADRFVGAGSSSNWRIGVAGDVGPAGAAGPAGPAGPGGPAGPAGPSGPAGAAGPAGPPGPPGPGATRYTLDAGPPSGAFGTFSKANDATMSDLCRDGDGCTIVIAMMNHDASKPGIVFSRKYHLFLSQSSNWWRTDGPDYDGLDGSGSTEEFSPWDCYFTDAEPTGASANGRTDNAVGLWLLNVKGGSYSDTTTVCRLIVED